MTKPRNKTIRDVVNYLAEQGLEIMGPNADLETGQLRGGCRNFNAEETIQFLKLDELWIDPNGDV